ANSDSRMESEPEEDIAADAAVLDTRIPAPLSVVPRWGGGHRIDPRAEVALALLRVRLSEQRPNAAPSSTEHPGVVSTAESNSLRRTNDFPLVDPRESP
ncbi:MAG: hypothetical protein NT069_13805, partial [Planctomycetota bacterium]|nr:hypothetical protein [Planctomycetota bacterium]